MAQSLIPPPSKMDMKGDIISNWAYFKDSWENYTVAVELNEKDKKVQVATLLSVLGKECMQLYKTLPLTAEQRKDPDVIIQKLTEHFEPQRNTIYERYLFNLTKQEANETFDQFLTRLRELVCTCEYGALTDEMVRDRIVIGIKENEPRGRMLRDNKLTLPGAIDICRTNEQTSYQRSKIEGTENIHYQRGRNPRKQYGDRAKPRNCKYCGDTHIPGNCKAYGVTCEICHKKNHLAKVCHSTNKVTNKSQPYKSKKEKKYKPHKVHQVERHGVAPDDYDTQSSDDSLFHIISSPAKTQYFANVHMRSEDDKTAMIKVQLDTGATCSTITLRDYHKITHAPMQHSDATLRLYDNTIVKPVGRVKLRCTSNDLTKKVYFEVVKEAPVSLLSGRACEALQLIQFNEQFVCSIEKVPQSPAAPALTKENLVTEYKDVFDGLGKLPGQYHIDIDTNVKAVQNNPRRVPIPIKTELKEKLDDYEKLNVIAKVNTPTPWISNMVAVRKPNKLRVCLDPYDLNKAINRNHYPTPTIDDVAPRLNKARIFSVVDAKDGFLQIELDEESSFLTTFWTPFGRYRWLRMPFGLKSAPEEFQRRLDTCLEGLENIEVIADDIIIYGCGDNDEEAEKSHDKALHALLLRCRERGLKLNKKKLRFKLTSVTYMGHTLSAEGMSPDKEKIKAIMEMPTPTDTQGVQRLIGVVTYLAKFMPQLSTVCEPLRRLTDKDAVFDWLPQHDTAFSTIKELITKAPVLHYYDVNKPVTIECDSSEVGLGAVITQNGHPIAYASRALTQTERNYAQIEKECLGIVYATERFHQYIIGKENVEIITDHKPLVTIFKKSILTSPKRLQRMRLRLQKFSINVVYKPGPQMYISDTLSRAALPLQQIHPDDSNYIIFQLKQEEESRLEFESVDMEESLFVTNHRLQSIRQHTAADNSLQVLMTIIKKGWPENKTSLPLCVREYWAYRDELSTQNGLVFRGTRIIIPSALRPELITRAHASHMGIQYTIGTARDIMYWPRMNAELTEAVQKCTTCQQSQPAQSAEPMMTHPIPELPWQFLSCDCFEYEQKNYLVMVDHYSDYIEIVPLKDLTSKTMIKCMKPIFATHGSPSVLLTDGASYFVSSEFEQFTTSWDIKHVTSSPYHHKSNGKAEVSVKLAKNIVKKTSNNGDLWKAILEWRNAITPGMKSSPVQRLMSRRTRSFLPCGDNLYRPQVINDVSEGIIRKRQVAKSYHDKTVKQLPPLIVGQHVQVKLKPQLPRSDWTLGTIVDSCSPRSYTVEVNGKQYRRNRVHLRDSSAQSEAISIPRPSSDSSPNHSDVRIPVTNRENITETSEAESAPVMTDKTHSNSAPIQSQTSELTKSAVKASPNQTRYGRVIKKPKKLIESV